MREYPDGLLCDKFDDSILPSAFCLASKSLREMDIELMRRLSPRVNVIPVVGKADSLTPSELRAFKTRVSYLTSFVSCLRR